MVAPLSSTSRRLRKHAIAMEAAYAGERVLSYEVSAVTSVLLDRARMLDDYIADSAHRADSMTHVEALERMRFAHTMHEKSRELLANALLWQVTAEGRRQVHALQQESKRLHQSHPRRREIEGEIEQVRDFISAVLRKDDGGDGGDSGGSDTGSGTDSGGTGNDSSSTDSGDGTDTGGGSHYNPDEPRDWHGRWTSDGGDDGSGDSTGANSGNETQMAQEIPPSVFFEKPPVTPPFEQLPQDPTIPPGPGWIWKGDGPPGSPEGSWYNSGTKEVLRPDMDHPPPQGPHWDYRGPPPDREWYRWNPDGTMTPKVVVGGIIA